MESRERNSLAAEEISKVSSSLGEANEVLGRISDAGNFTILGQEQSVVIME